MSLIISIYPFSAGIKVVGKGVAKPVIKDGKEYLQVDKVITKVKIGNGQISFDKTERPLAGKLERTSDRVCSFRWNSTSTFVRFRPHFSAYKRVWRA